jgi:hypothetical protein
MAFLAQQCIATVIGVHADYQPVSVIFFWEMANIFIFRIKVLGRMNPEYKAT